MRTAVPAKKKGGLAAALTSFRELHDARLPARNLLESIGRALEIHPYYNLLTPRLSARLTRSCWRNAAIGRAKQHAHDTEFHVVADIQHTEIRQTDYP